MLDEHEIRPLLEAALGAIAYMDMAPDGNMLGNFIITGDDADRLVVVDLERIDWISAMPASSGAAPISRPLPTAALISSSTSTY